MVIANLFSKRQKALRGDVPDVYSYDDLPKTLRTQIIYIWADTISCHDPHGGAVRSGYKFITDTLCREYGLLRLPGDITYLINRNYPSELTQYFLNLEENVERQLDVVELSFNCIDSMRREYSLGENPSEVVDNAITELNNRFKEHGVGFQFIEGEIVRVDSELIHVEAVKPALSLLNEKKYHGAQQEFLSAYEHYRHGKHKEALNDCLKSFESTMKAICDKHNWDYNQNATAKALIKVCFDNDLVPSFWQQQFNSLRSILESSIPTGRNKLSGHGQGATPTVVPNYLVAYMLHMTASTLVFLTTAEKNIA